MAPPTTASASSAASDTDTSAYKAFYSAQGSVVPRLWITYTHVPTVPTPAAPAEGAVMVDDTPTLMINPSTDPEGDPILYWFRVGTGPNVVGGNEIDSGWLNAATPGYVPCAAGSPTGAICWTVPAGVLSDGVYRWHAFAWDGIFGNSFMPPPNDDAHRRSFRVTLRLGSGGPAPTDAIGPVQANLASGNVVATHAGPRFPTVGGDVGVGFAYNAGARTNGLLGEYYPGSSLPAATTAPALTRTDAQLAFNWADTAPAPTLGKDNYVVRWSGNFTVPSAGSYRFYAGTTDGMRIFVDNVQVTPEAEWTTPGYVYRQVNATAVSFAAGALTKAIRVEYREQADGAYINLGVIMPSGAGLIVPASWFTAPSVGPLPAGWTLSAGSALAYTSARLGEHGVTLTDATGGLHTYAATGADPSSGWGYTPPSDEDGVLARAADGTLTLIAPDGVSYVFDGSGTLRHATTALDDANQASARYLWTFYAGMSRLEAISDPVSGRQITLHYKSFNPALGCDTPPSGQNLAPAPTGKLCQVDYWDGTFTRLWYNAAGQLVRISEDPTSNPTPTAPGDQPSRSDLAYDSKRLLATVRDPLAIEAMRVGVTGVPTDPNNDATRTLITYYDDGRVKDVTLPVPYTGNGSAAGARPGHDYAYGPGDTASVSVDGLAGVNRSVSFDAAGRLSESTDATGRAGQYLWDAADRLLTTTAAGRSIASVYDDDEANGTPDRVQSSGRVTHSYGPAPASCFSVANNVVTVSCADAPHTHTAYDAPGEAPATGLAVTAWDNRDFAGAPRLRDGVVPTAGALVGGDLAGVPAGAWSARYTGEIDLGTGTYGYGVAATGGTARLFVDDTLVADSSAGGSGVLASTVAGRHRFRVDFSATAANPGLAISWTPPAGSSQAIDSSVLAPRWANPTTTTTDDSLGVPASVATATYTSLAEGMVSENTVDPAGLDLTTTVAYEEPGDGSSGRFRRPLRRTLPAGNPADASTGTTYAHYAGFVAPATAAESATNPCPGGVAANQGGRVRSTTGPDPDGAGSATPRVTEVVYDAAGRVVASRVGTEAWSCLAYDRKGRLLSRSFPADADQGGHVYTFDYANPMVTVSKEGATTLSTTVSDMVGRVVSYTDRWAKTTTSSYDQAGRRTDSAGPVGSMHVTYDAAGRVQTQSLDGALMATATYDSGGELDTVAYNAALNGGNGSSLAVVRHAGTGMVSKLTWAGTGGTLATDEVFRSRSGKVIDERTDGTDAFGAWATEAGANFVYDGARRLELARVEGQSLDYGFATSGGCGPQDGPGRNANRSSVSLNGGADTTYCYDTADRLTSSSDAAVGSPTYDSHGNTATLGTQALAYDSADRHVATSVSGTAVVSYDRDATDRIVARTEASTVIHYGFTGPGDSSGFTMDAANNVTERMIAAGGRGDGDQAGRTAGRQRRVELPQHPRRRHGRGQHRRRQAGRHLQVRPLRPAPPGRRRGARQLGRQLRLRMARPAPAPSRARRHHRHHRDGRSTVCAGAGTVPRGRSRSGRVV